VLVFPVGVSTWIGSLCLEACYEAGLSGRWSVDESISVALLRDDPMDRRCAHVVDVVRCGFPSFGVCYGGSGVAVVPGRVMRLTLAVYHHLAAVHQLLVGSCTAVS